MRYRSQASGRTGHAAPVSTTVEGVPDAQRRQLLQLLGAGGLLLAAGVGGVRRLQAAEAETPSAGPGTPDWNPLAYVVVHEDGRVTIICHRSEMGQGIRTTMPMIIADEMEADWKQCSVQ